VCEETDYWSYGPQVGQFIAVSAFRTKVNCFRTIFERTHCKNSSLTL
jgi:hypothetical protein